MTRDDTLIRDTVREAIEELLDLAPEPPRHPHVRVAAPNGTDRSGGVLAAAAGITAIAGVAGSAWLLTRPDAPPTAGTPTSSASTLPSASAEPDGTALVAPPTTTMDGQTATSTIRGVDTTRVVAPPTSVIDDGSAGAPSNPGLRPTVIPDGLRFVGVRNPSVSLVPAHEGERWFVLGSPDADGAVETVIDVSITYGRVFAPPPDAGYTREGVSVNGVPGEIVRDEINGRTTVAYQWGEQAVSIDVAEQADDDLVATMVAIGDALRIDEGTVELVRDTSGRVDLPVGVVVLATSDVLVDVEVGTTTLVYANDRNVELLEVMFVPDPVADAPWWWADAGITPVTIGGRDGFVTTHPSSSDGASVSVVWLERDDLLIRVSAFGMGDAGLVATMRAAESLEALPDGEWEQMVAETRDAAGQSPVAPPTTTTLVIVDE